MATAVRAVWPHWRVGFEPLPKLAHRLQIAIRVSGQERLPSFIGQVLVAVRIAAIAWTELGTALTAKRVVEFSHDQHSTYALRRWGR